MFVTFNVFEGSFWIALAVGVVVVLWRRRQKIGLMAVLAGLLIAFGVSDWVEISTGGWYRPWWMLVWKALNLGGLIVTALLLRMQRRDVAG